MDPKTIRVMVIEYNPEDANYVLSIFAEAGNNQLSAVWVTGLQAGLERLHEPGFDIIFLDTSLPDAEGRDPLAEVRSKAPDVPVVLLTGPEGETAAAEAVRSRGCIRLSREG